MSINLKSSRALKCYFLIFIILIIFIGCFFGIRITENKKKEEHMRSIYLSLIENENIKMKFLNKNFNKIINTNYKGIYKDLSIVYFSSIFSEKNDDEKIIKIIDHYTDVQNPILREILYYNLYNYSMKHGWQDFNLSRETSPIMKNLSYLLDLKENNDVSEGNIEEINHVNDLDQKTVDMIEIIKKVKEINEFIDQNDQ